LSGHADRSYLAIASAIAIAGVLISASLYFAVGQVTKTVTTTTTVTSHSTSASSSTSHSSATTSTSFSNTTSSSTTSSCAGCGPPSFWVNYSVNGTVPVINKFEITQGTSYSVSVPTDTGVTFTFFGNGVISYPTMVCNGSNCPSQTFDFLQYQTCTPGALFCPSSNELTTINFMTPGYYSLTFSYFTTPDGPQVSNSLAVLAK